MAYAGVVTTVVKGSNRLGGRKEMSQSWGSTRAASESADRLQDIHPASPQTDANSKIEESHALRGMAGRLAV
ncbi:MAG: hypothetical protein AAB363_01670 [Planctomycetota bacterium]